MKEKRLLITGANGFSGQHACQHFSAAGFHVVALIRGNTTIEENSIDVKQCDLTHRSAVTELIHDVKPHFILHLAGQNHVGQSWKDPIGSLEANALATAYLLEAVRQESPSCKMIITGSALQFDPHHLSTVTHPYSLSKTIQALLAHSWNSLYGMNIIIAKPSNLIGPGLSNGVCSIFAKKIAETEKYNAGHVLEVSSLQAKRDFLDVRDAIRAYEVLFTHARAGDIYDISSSVQHSLAEVIEEFQNMTHIKLNVITQHTEREASPPAANSEKLRRLGWQPMISFESSLQDTLNFYRQLL